MSRSRQALIALLVASLAAGGLYLVLPASAHGGTVDPPTRTYTCYFLDPDNPACAAAWGYNPQAMYDWMEVNIGNADGRHRELIPDGKLCSAGREKYAAFDAARADWPATSVSPGPVKVRYQATAPHATLYFRYYMTRADFDITQPLKWSDLELIHDSGRLPQAPSYEFDMAYPQRSGRHIMYMVWQRSDSPEAFYDCIDLDFGGGTSTTNPAPTTTVGNHPVGATELPVSLTTQTDWGAGACYQGRVTNTTASTVTWSTTVMVAGTVTSNWDSVMHGHGMHVHVTGPAWRPTLAAGQTTSFGYCIARGATGSTSTTSTTTAPTTTVRPTTSTTTAPTTTVRPTTTTTAPVGAQVRTTAVRTAQWNAGSCWDVSVRNMTDRPVTWRVSVPATGRITSLWNAVGGISGSTLTVGGAAWNRTIGGGATTSFGYCLTTA